MHKIKSFSVIELIATVAIVAIIAMVARHTYRDYIIRRNIGVAMITIQDIISMSIKYHQRVGTFSPPGWSSMPYNGVNIMGPSGPATPLVYNKSNIWSIGYLSPHFWGTTPTTGVPWQDALLLNFPITGLTGVPGYVDPGPFGASVGQRSSIYFAIRMQNGVYTVKCGQYGYGADLDSLPLAYLPKNCQCTAMRTWMYTGTGCP